MHYFAKNQHFCASRVVKFLSICFLLVVVLLIAGCDDEDGVTSNSEDTNLEVTSYSENINVEVTGYSEDTNPDGDNTLLVTPVPSAFILGGLGLAFSGWILKKKRMF